jgi:RecT family
MTWGTRPERQSIDWDKAAAPLLANLRTAKAAREAAGPKTHEQLVQDFLASPCPPSRGLIETGFRHFKKVCGTGGVSAKDKAMLSYYSAALESLDILDKRAAAPTAQEKTMTNIVPMQSAAPVPAPAPVWRGAQLRDIDDQLRFAKIIAAGGMAPKSYAMGGADLVAAIFTSIQLGGELGLTPMASVQNIAVINGRPGLWGSAMLAVVEASGKLAEIEEFFEGEGEARTAVCLVTRVGRKTRRFTFSMADAKRAKLTGKQGPWQEYPDRMLLARARSFALRDVFPDVLLGLAQSAEELGDIPEEARGPDRAKDVTPPKAEPAAPCAPCAPARKVITLVGLPGDWPNTGQGALNALAVLKAQVEVNPKLAFDNEKLLTWLETRFVPEVAEIRALAAKALTPPHAAHGAAAGQGDAEQEIPDEPDPFDMGQKMAERRGAAPTDTATTEELDEALG